MSLRFPSLVVVLLLGVTAAQAGELRVCADPDNLPFSDARGEGFENRIVALLAREMGMGVAYVWANERRATAIEMMNKGRCDLVPGAIAGAVGVATTQPYMRSTYALVLRGDARVSGFDDPQLRRLRIGVQSVGDDAVTPPVEALLHRGLGDNLRPFTLHGNAADPNTAGGMVRAVAARDIDAAVLWGPFAGYYAARQATAMTVVPVTASPDDPRMDFAIGMAVRAGDVALRDALDRALAAKRDAIAAVLAEYRVPLLPVTGAEVSP